MTRENYHFGNVARQNFQNFLLATQHRICQNKMQYRKSPERAPPVYLNLYTTPLSINIYLLYIYISVLFAGSPLIITLDPWSLRFPDSLMPEGLVPQPPPSPASPAGFQPPRHCCVEREEKWDNIQINNQAFIIIFTVIIVTIEIFVNLFTPISI